MEISELVGTVLVQINEGSFNFTGTGTLLFQRCFGGHSGLL